MACAYHWKPSGGEYISPHIYIHTHIYIYTHIYKYIYTRCCLPILWFFHQFLYGFSINFFMVFPSISLWFFHQFLYGFSINFFFSSPSYDHKLSQMQISFLGFMTSSVFISLFFNFQKIPPISFFVLWQALYFPNCVSILIGKACAVWRGGGLGSRPIFKKFNEPYAPS